MSRFDENVWRAGLKRARKKPNRPAKPKGWDAVPVLSAGLLLSLALVAVRYLPGLLA